MFHLANFKIGKQLGLVFVSVVADRVSADQGAIARRIATMTVARHAGKEILEQVLTIRRDYGLV